MRFSTIVTSIAGWGVETGCRGGWLTHAADAHAKQPQLFSALSFRTRVPVSQWRFTRLSQQGHFGFVVQSKVIPRLILINLCRKWYVFHQFIWGITFQTIMPRLGSVCWNLLSSFKLKVRPLQIKGCCFSNHSLYMEPRGTADWRYPLWLTVLSFLCSSSFKSFIKNNRSSCSFNFYNNNMLENSLKRYRRYVFYFQTTDPRGLSSGY